MFWRPARIRRSVRRLPLLRGGGPLLLLDGLERADGGQNVAGLGHLGYVAGAVGERTDADPMRDPEIVFEVTADTWRPVSIQQAAIGLNAVPHAVPNAAGSEWGGARV